MKSMLDITNGMMYSMVGPQSDDSSDDDASDDSAPVPTKYEATGDIYYSSSTTAGDSVEVLDETLFTDEDVWAKVASHSR